MQFARHGASDIPATLVNNFVKIFGTSCENLVNSRGEDAAIRPSFAVAKHPGEYCVNSVNNLPRLAPPPLHLDHLYLP